MCYANTDNLHQKLLYIQCIPAASAAAEYGTNVETLLPFVEELGLNEDEPEEVKLEVAVQLPALGAFLDLWSSAQQLALCILHIALVKNAQSNAAKQAYCKSVKQSHRSLHSVHTAFYMKLR